MDLTRVVLAGWARTAVPAGVGSAVASQDPVLTVLVVLVASAWYLAWTTLEITVDVRFGVMLGYAAVRPKRWKALRDVMATAGDIDALLDIQAETLGQVGHQSRHARAHAREGDSSGLPRLPHLPRPRRSRQEVVDVS